MHYSATDGRIRATPPVRPVRREFAEKLEADTVRVRTREDEMEDEITSGRMSRGFRAKSAQTGRRLGRRFLACQISAPRENRMRILRKRTLRSPPDDGASFEAPHRYREALQPCRKGFAASHVRVMRSVLRIASSFDEAYDDSIPKRVWYGNRGVNSILGVVTTTKLAE